MGEPKVVAQDLCTEPAKILYRYNQFWYCLKTIKGVTFKLFDGVGYQISDLVQARRDIKGCCEGADSVFERQLARSVKSLYERALSGPTGDGSD